MTDTLNWQAVSKSFEGWQRLASVELDSGEPHVVSGVFFAPKADQYPDFLENIGEKQGSGYLRAEFYFDNSNPRDAIVPDGQVKLVDHMGEHWLSEAEFFSMAFSFCKFVLMREAELELIAQGKLPAEWRTRIEAVLPKLEALAKG